MGLDGQNGTKWRGERMVSKRQVFEVDNVKLQL